jgi:hypothetical protein
MESALIDQAIVVHYARGAARRRAAKIVQERVYDPLRDAMFAAVEEGAVTLQDLLLLDDDALLARLGAIPANLSHEQS